MRKIRRQLRKHRNLIFTLGEIGLATGAVIFAGRGSFLYMDETYDDEHTDSEKGKALVKSYWPAVACYAGFVTLRIFDCISTTKIQRDYSAALLGLGTVAAGVSQNKITGLPEEKRAEIKKEIKDSGKDYKIFYYADDLPALAEYTKGNKSPAPGCDDFFYIPQFDILICSSMYDIENAENKSRLRYESDQDVYLNNVLDDMGAEPKGFGEDYYISGHDHDFGEDETPFSYDISPAMTIDDDSVLFYVINFNKKWKSVYDVD